MEHVEVTSEKKLQVESKREQSASTSMKATSSLEESKAEAKQCSDEHFNPINPNKKEEEFRNYVDSERQEVFETQRFSAFFFVLAYFFIFFHDY